MKERRQHGKLAYRAEALVMRLRDMVRPPARVLQAVGAAPGMTVLDFGCGPGGFSLAAAKLVGSAGLVYALDIQPLALEAARRGARRRHLDNVQPVMGEDIAKIPAESVDLALLYDVLHIDPTPAAGQAKLAAIHRVLKPGGVLSVSDHHLGEDELRSIVSAGELFRTVGQVRGRHQFTKTQSQ